MCDLETTKTSEQLQNFTPQQLAAQRIGLETIAHTMPQYNENLLRALGLIQPGMPGADILRQPMHQASQLVRGALATGLEQQGLPMSSYAPALQALESDDIRSANAARNAIMDTFLKGAPIALYRPDLAQYIARPKSIETVQTSEEGTGAQLLKTAGTFAGILSSFA